ncbi:hypothetical protein ACIRU3_27165 [Streptomyces sp. NPDC101151]|uniref:hypothetical protein n=1 Tax=Streptomyces sp. NPDC101151 TaxID=3366115 RepID=UPI003811E286
MTITQQHQFDTYRARLHGEPEPPAPGRHDVGLMRELREYRRFRAVLAERPALACTASPNRPRRAATTSA